jgi:hypothetical protein
MAPQLNGTTADKQQQTTSLLAHYQLTASRSTAFIINFALTHVYHSNVAARLKL